MYKHIAISAAAAFALFALTALHPAPAFANFRVCNQSGEKIAVAIAYYGSDDDGWITEGWWNLNVGDCATPISADLENRYYYLYADGDQHTWTGDYDNCVDASSAFTLKHADSDCNFTKKSFFKVDTGETGTDYTYTFT